MYYELWFANTPCARSNRRKNAKNVVFWVHILRVEGHKNDIGERAGAPYDILSKFHARIRAVRGETADRISQFNHKTNLLDACIG